MFSETIPRAFLPSPSCGKHCYTKQEIAGLITSAAIQQAPFLVPDVVQESDTCLAIPYPNPAPRTKTHYVLFPKHDVKNIAMLTPEDVPYVLGCFAMLRELVQRDKLENYYVRTNGPGKQEIAYLHFHLIANK
ncbi:HIT domain-containing protein [Thiothrix nivea]|uniref:HIT domain-containing protein n=1 Tax=Thiothrix nivea TaxID=1031 RepID=UPI00145F4214|nr:HIT domain-containing protein [Thiothrix nivea]